ILAGNPPAAGQPEDLAEATPSLLGTAAYNARESARPIPEMKRFNRLVTEKCLDLDGGVIKPQVQRQLAEEEKWMTEPINPPKQVQRGLASQPTKAKFSTDRKRKKPKK